MKLLLFKKNDINNLLNIFKMKNVLIETQNNDKYIILF